MPQVCLPFATDTKGKMQYEHRQANPQFLLGLAPEEETQETRHGAHAGSRPHVAVVYPFLQEAPLGRVIERPGDEGYKRSMPCGRTECKRKLNRVKPRCQWS
jgi:hypothetical protein